MNYDDDFEIEIIIVKNLKFCRVYAYIEDALENQGFDKHQNSIILETHYLNEGEDPMNMSFVNSVTNLRIDNDSFYYGLHKHLIKFIKNKTVHTCEVMESLIHEGSWDVIFYINRDE